MQYVKVVQSETDEPVELPTEDDGTLLLSTLAAQFTGSCGLKYRNPDTNTMRGIRLADDRLHPPEGGIWADYLYLTSYPTDNATGDRKRKAAEDTSADELYHKTKKFDSIKTTDLLILGMPYKSTEEDIRQYFSQFGELLMVQLKRDAMTGRSKGFGFVRYVDYGSQLKCLSQGHMMDGRTLDIKIPASKDGVMPQLSRKIFVGRLTEDLTTDDLREFFSKFGEIIDVYIPKPFRGFAFVTFNDPQSARQVCGENYIIKGASVHCSSAAAKGTSPGMSAGYGGGGGSYGSYGGASGGSMYR